MAAKNDEIRVGSNVSQKVRTQCRKCPGSRLAENSNQMLTKMAVKNDEIQVGSNFSQIVRTPSP